MAKSTSSPRDPNSYLWHHPTNVKECIDWMSCISKGNATDLQKAIHKIPGCNGITGVDTVCKAVCSFLDRLNNSTYIACYNTQHNISDVCKDAGKSNAQTTCCQAGSGDHDPCRKCKGNTTCDGGCCQYCPLQICARIFCLIVPILYDILKHMEYGILKDKPNDVNGWKKGNINLTTSKVGLFLNVCGFTNNHLDNLSGEDIKSELETVNGQLKQVKEKIYQQGLYQQDAVFMGSSEMLSDGAPKTISDYLLWLFFLPYCCSNYNGFIGREGLEKYLPGSERKSFAELVDNIPFLFFLIEDHQGNQMFNKIATLCKGEHIFNYYNSATHCARMFCLIIPVLRNILDYLNTKCKNSWKGAIDKDSESYRFILTCGFKNRGRVRKGSDIVDLDGYGGLNKLVLRLGTFTDRIIEGFPQQDVNSASSTRPDLKGVAMSPDTISSFLRWLYFLPYCSPYGTLLYEVNKLLKSDYGSGSSVSESLSILFQQLPMLILSIEGMRSSFFDDLQKVTKGEYTFSIKTYSDPQHCLKIMYAFFPVLHWSFDKLRSQRCTEGQRCRGVKDCSGELNHFLGKIWYKPSSQLPINGAILCYDLQEYLEQSLFTNIAALDRVKSVIAVAMQSEYNGVDCNKSNGHKEPSSIRDMILWLQGLPVSGVFRKLRDVIYKLPLYKSRQFRVVFESMTNIMFSTSSLFYTIEDGVYHFVNDLLETQIGSDDNLFKYDDSVVGTFASVIGILHAVFRYLQRRVKDANLGGEWVNFNVNGTSNEKSSLNTFCRIMGWTEAFIKSSATGKQLQIVLHECFGDLTKDSSGTLNALYSCAVECIRHHQRGLQVSQTTYKPPSTIKEMMLWLVGLPFLDKYSQLTAENGTIDTKVAQKTGTSIISTQVANNQVFASCRDLVVPIIAIEGNASSVFAFLKQFINGGPDTLLYGEKDELFSQLCGYCYKVHTQLMFLYRKCLLDGSYGGWKNCIYGQKNTCNCSNDRRSSCMNTFLQGESESIAALKKQSAANDGSKYYGLFVKDDKNIGMGFFTTMSPSNQLQLPYTGRHISDILRPLFVTFDTDKQSRSAAMSLSTLLQCLIYIGNIEPMTLADIVEVIKHVADRWDELSIVGNEKFKARLVCELNAIPEDATAANQANGEYYVNELRDKIRDLFPSLHPSGPLPHTILNSLFPHGEACASTSGTCGPYMEPLSHKIYTYYSPNLSNVNMSNPRFHALQWLYDKIKQLFDELKCLKQSFDNCICCAKSGSCPGLMSCAEAHATLYRFGFTFVEPKKLNKHDCNSLRNQLKTVLMCKNKRNKSGSVLYSVFDKLVEVSFKILLEKTKASVDAHMFTAATNGTVIRRVFKKYVHNAVNDSYAKFMCTFVDQIFDENHDCSTEQCSELRVAPASMPRAVSSSIPISVRSIQVDSIAPIITSYRLPHIDALSYRLYKKAGPNHSPSSNIASNEVYEFKDSMDFHVKGTQFLVPHPTSLRSIIDWILRVSVGHGARIGEGKVQGNQGIIHLSDEINGILSHSLGSPPVKELVSHIKDGIASLVLGLRGLMGYGERDRDIHELVDVTLGESEQHGLKKELDEIIHCIEGFITQKEDDSKKFGVELGKAMMKGKFWVKRYDFASQPFPVKYELTKVIEELMKLLTIEHVCDVDGIECSTLPPSASGGLPLKKDGLHDLNAFFELVARFERTKYEIGINNGGNILNKKRVAAEKRVSQIAMHGVITDKDINFFGSLSKALQQLGDCSILVKQLIGHDGLSAPMDSGGYKKQICELINGLNKALETLKYRRRNNVSVPIPLDGTVEANKRVIEETKRGIEKHIKWRIHDSVISKYNSFKCIDHSSHKGHKSGKSLCLNSLIKDIQASIASDVSYYESHLDDLKKLCQWLYRMGQLYKAGLKGFIESLVGHLKHIIEVIKWIEGIKNMVKGFSNYEHGKKTASELLKTPGLVNSLDHCCKRHMNLNNNGIFTNPQDFFTALHCRIDNMLASYVLDPVQDVGDKINTEDVKRYRQVLGNLRTLVHDIYTLQLWQDNREKIRGWVTFQGGMAKNSALGDIRSSLSQLTGFATKRVHQFHAICLLQKYSHHTTIAKFEDSLNRLRLINSMLKRVYVISMKRTTSLRNSDVETFCSLVSMFCKEEYGLHSFAKFLGITMGPNFFSAIITSLDVLCEYDDLNDDVMMLQFRNIVKTLHDGSESESSNKERYTLDNTIKNLQHLIDVLRREYIFSYPRLNTFTYTSVLTEEESGHPSCLLNLEEAHKESPVCGSCYPYLAKIFMGCIPNLYKHFKLLYGMCGQKRYWNDNELLYVNNGNLERHYAHLSLTGYLSRNGWVVKGDHTFNTEGKSVELNHTIYGAHMIGPLSNMISMKEGDLKCLDHLYRSVMEHFGKARKSKIEAMIQNHPSDFYRDNRNNGLKFVAPQRYIPSTVRETLFWLHEVDQQSTFYEGLCGHIENLCDQTSTNISYDTIMHVLKLSITQSLEVLSSIENPAGQNPTYLYDLYTEEHYYDYGSTTVIPVFFHTFMEKLMAAFLQLNFLCIQCEFPALEGGWSECHLQGVDASKAATSVTCRCKPSQSPSSNTDSCNLPLSTFLYDEKKNPITVLGMPDVTESPTTPNRLPSGFKYKIKNSDNSSQPTVSGGSLVTTLKHLVGGYANGRWEGNTNSSLYTMVYLRDLLRYFLCLTVRPPWSLGENMAFFYWLSRSWGTTTQAGTPWGDPKILSNIQTEIKSCPGTFNPALLTDAVEVFAGLVEKKHIRQGPNAHAHTHDVRSIVGCKSPSSPTSASCTPYICPLTFDVYTHFDHQHARAYLSWILHFGPAIYTALQKLKESIEGHFHTSNTGPVSTLTCSSSSIVQCPLMLPQLYKLGLHFGDARILSDGTSNTGATGKTTSVSRNARTCSQLFDQLGAVLRTCEDSTPPSPLHALIEVIEQFLWSIREPFAYTQFGLWALATLFLCYVFVVPLDHFKIKSHYFNQVRFTMHPSLLLSHGARKVTDVSYFKM